MSAFYSFRYPDRVCILADAGVFNDDGRLAAIEGKVSHLRHLPIALTCRGNLEACQVMTRRLLAIAANSVDAWLRAARDVATSQRLIGPLDCEILIACFSPRLGPAHFFVAFHDRHGAAFEVQQQPVQFGCGPPIGLDDLPPGAADEVSSPTFPDRYGVDIMSAMRRRPAIVPGQAKAYRIVGGYLELTTVTAAGVTVRKLHDWNDKIGEPIQ